LAHRSQADLVVRLFRLAHAGELWAIDSFENRSKTRVDAAEQATSDGAMLALAAAVALGLAGLWLAAVCWRRRSVLGVLCGIVGTASAIGAAATGSAGHGARAALAGSAAAVAIGTVLLALGQAVQRLLDEQPGEDV
jgi:hypothetical protein